MWTRNKVSALAPLATQRFKMIDRFCLLDKGQDRPNLTVQTLVNVSSRLTLINIACVCKLLGCVVPFVDTDYRFASVA